MIPENRIRRFLQSNSKTDAPTGHIRRERDTNNPGSEGLRRPADSFADLLRLSSPDTTDSLFWRPPSPAEVRVHALLNERLAALRRSRRGLWSRIWHSIRGD
jgi:hypothetical protein